jgi:flagellar M-ring protein FliF
LNYREWLAKFSSWWRDLSRSRKIIITSSAIGAVVVLAVIGQVLFSTPYAPLFTGLDPKDAGKITEELKKENIPYRISDQGKTIEVPEDIVYETRINLASNGALYSSGVGFELFDQSKFGVTEFEQQVGYQRALQEELRRTITQIDGVEQARVHLVLPKESLFLSEQTEPSASIAIKLKPTAKIPPENVRGIVELVSGSVQGLKKENIHIIDMEGNSLTEGLKLGDEDASMTIAALEHLELRRSYEKELEDRIQNMLRKILGSGKAVAMVTADLDFDKTQYTSTTYDTGQVLSENVVTETGIGPGGSGGVPGTDTNLPGETIPAEGGGDSASYSREETTTNYQVPTRQENVIKSLGSVRKLSASVVLNGNYSQAEIQQINEVVAAAIGYQEERGDQINVSSMAFDDAELKAIADEMSVASAMEEQKRKYIKYALIGLGVLTVLAALALYLVKRRKSSLEAEQSIPEEAMVETAATTETIQVPPVVTKKDKVKEVTRKNPEEVAEVLKIWIKE